jgi:hypothetical protein
MIKMFLQRVILVMLLAATSLVSFARFDSGYSHPDHSVQSDHYSNHTQHAPNDLLTESVEEGFEEEVESSDFIETTCFCKNASRWVDFSETNYSSAFHVIPASERCVILSVFRL